MGIFGDLLNYENVFFRGVNKMVDGIFASVLWLLFCLPIVTAGTATTAFYYTVHKVLRGNRGYVWRSFWSCFRSNFRQTVKIWLVILAVFLLSFYARYFIYSDFTAASWGMGMFYYFFSVVMLVLVVWSVYLFAHAARFRMGMKDAMKNTALLAVAHLPWSLLILLLFVAGVYAVKLLFPLGFLFVPVLVCCLYELILERIFGRYMSQEDLEREEELKMHR